MRFIASLLLATLLAGAAAAEEVEVDLELVLLVDVSRSMSLDELEIQRRGYAAAIDSDAVFAAVQTGLLQRVAVTYVEWAGSQEVIVDWRLLQTREDLAEFAEILSSRFNAGRRRTSISEALVFAAEAMESNRYAGLRRVIDVSGDGPNNEGRMVTLARDAVLAEGTIINGLPLMTREGMGSRWHLADLDLYYESCVTGGPGSFVIPVLEWADFTDAVRRKLVLEMVSRPGPEALVPAQYEGAGDYDCMIGEKMWRDQRRFWEGP